MKRWPKTVYLLHVFGHLFTISVPSNRWCVCDCLFSVNLKDEIILKKYGFLGGHLPCVYTGEVTSHSSEVVYLLISLWLFPLLHICRKTFWDWKRKKLCHVWYVNVLLLSMSLMCSSNSMLQYHFITIICSVINFYDLHNGYQDVCCDVLCDHSWVFSELSLNIVSL